MPVLEGYADGYGRRQLISAEKIQTQALKRIQASIPAFGGDPDNVTIMGQFCRWRSS